MLSYNEAFHGLITALAGTYDAQEAKAIAQRYMEHLTGLTYTQRLVRRDGALSTAEQEMYDKDVPLLAVGKPLQQVAGYEWFMNRKFCVNEHVLIPRPETEELVEWIVADSKDRAGLQILDIGTGSGCIPISLKLAMPQSEIISCDISPDALMVAKINALTYNAAVEFLEADFLDHDVQDKLPNFDIIVSNPPYIPETEAANMHVNVTKYEPHLALFVPGDDPLLFYRAIAMFGRQHLKAGGVIYCELHTDHAVQTADMFKELLYKCELRNDMHGNPRMLKAVL